MLICVFHVEFNKLTYLLNMSEHYHEDADVIRHLHIFVHTAIAPQEPARLLQHLFYVIADEAIA